MVGSVSAIAGETSYVNHPFFRSSSGEVIGPDKEEIRKHARNSLLKASTSDPQIKDEPTEEPQINCFKTLGEYCFALHDLLVEAASKGDLKDSQIYELMVRAVTHIDKIGQNLVDVIMPKTIQEWRVFGEEMAEHFLKLPFNLAKYRNKKSDQVAHQA